MKYFSRPASFLDSERIRSGPTDSPPPPSATTYSLDRFFEEEVDALGGESQPTVVGLGQAVQAPGEAHGRELFAVEEVHRRRRQGATQARTSDRRIRPSTSAGSGATG